MYISLPNSFRDGGCKSNTPCRSSSVDSINISFTPLFPSPSTRSRQLISLDAQLYSKPSCSLKNSLNAGSSTRDDSLRGSRCAAEEGGTTEEVRLCFGVDDEEEEERQICARRDSSWRRPLRILDELREEMLSKERVSKASIFRCSVKFSPSCECRDGRPGFV